MRRAGGRTDGQSSAFARGEKFVQNFRWRYRRRWEGNIKMDVIIMVGWLASCDPVYRLSEPIHEPAVFIKAKKDLQ